MKVTEEDITELREICDLLADQLVEQRRFYEQNLEETKAQLQELQLFKSKVENTPVPTQMVYQYYPYPTYPAYQPQYYVTYSNPTPFSISSSSQT